MPLLTETFTKPLLAWFDIHGRKSLPWQQPRTPYRVYLSEIMLQQTQVKTVIPYFEKFIQRFPTIEALAAASEDEVLAHWSGLGYYARARHLHHSAQVIARDYQGVFPSDPLALIKLPGIGPSTAAAIASLAFHKPMAILDGNVKRILARYFMAPGALNDPKTHKSLLQYAEQCLSLTRAADYTQAIMDLGALCCRPKNPDCAQCPLKATCLAQKNGCTEAYPHPPKKKVLPHKTDTFFILSQYTVETGLQIYLEKRPSTGIWGGLWCLPTVCPPETTAPMPFQTLVHTFTHFHLTLQSFSVKPLATFTPSTERLHTWVAAHQLTEIGLPAPITQLLKLAFTQ